MKRQGFTLIELLTVVAIIALLVGIMVPMLGSARDSARTMLCATNLRSLQTGMSQFTADNSARYGGGLAKEWVTDNSWGVWWNEPGDHNRGEVNITGRGEPGDSDYAPSGDIWQYVQEPDIYLCPIFDRICGRPSAANEWAPGVTYGVAYSRSFDVEGSSETFTMPESFDARSAKPVRSYAMNELLAPYSRDAAGDVCRKTDQTVLINPNAIWLTEVHPWRKAWIDAETGDTRDPGYGFSRAHFGQDETPGQFHNGKANCSFGDGHVERLSPTEINANVRPPG